MEIIQVIAIVLAVVGSLELGTGRVIQVGLGSLHWGQLGFRRDQLVYAYRVCSGGDSGLG